MTENNAAAAEQETTNVLTDDQAMDKFQGFSTRDGERVDPDAQPAADKPAKKPAKGSVPSVKPDDSDGDDSGSDDDSGDDATQKHKSAQARINKAVGRQRAAERRADQLEARLAALEARSSTPAQQTTQQPAKKAETAPDPADYEYGELDKKYINDLVDYRVAQGLKTHQSQSKQEQSTAEQKKAQQEHQQRISEFYSKGIDIAEDFEEVVGDDGLKISPVLGELVLESEHGAQIVYTMASDPKEAKRVSAMSPQRQAAWFGTKEAELLSSESSDAEEDTETGEAGDSHSATSPKTTKAPPPPKGKTRGSGTAQQISPATSDFTQFERLAMKSQE